MSVSFEVHKLYNFNTRAPAILGANFKSVKVLGIIDYNLASKYINPETQHVNIYPYLPVGTVDDPKKYTYVLIETQSGDVTVLAMPWIDQESIALVTSRDLIITVKDIGTGDDVTIRDNLLLMGFNDITIEIKNN